MERLKTLRIKRGLSQARLAARAGLDPSTVNQIERGARDASPGTLYKLAEALEVGLVELLEGEAPKKAPAPPSSEPTLFNGVLEEERRDPRNVGVSELKNLIFDMRKRAEHRKRETEALEQQRIDDPIAWVIEAELADKGFEDLLKKEQILGFVEGVNGNRIMVSDEVRLLCQDFMGTYTSLQRLTNRARVIAQKADLSTAIETEKTISSVEAHLSAQDPRRDVKEA